MIGIYHKDSIGIFENAVGEHVEVVGIQKNSEGVYLAFVLFRGSQARLVLLDDLLRTNTDVTNGAEYQSTYVPGQTIPVNPCAELLDNENYAR